MKHTCSKYKDYPSLRRRGLNPIVRRVAIIPSWRTEYGPHGQETPLLTIETHGADKRMIRKVFNPWCGAFFNDYNMEWDEQNERINGKCYRLLVLKIYGPDLHRLSVQELMILIKSSMERRFRCEVTYFSDYEKFLNT